MPWFQGRYTSLEDKGRLAEEYDLFREAGYYVVGGRQHWLRYKSYSNLIEELSHAGACYDCSFGYVSHPGFRYGACFPFPPYDFASESAYTLLELPLVIMDVSLNSIVRSGKCPLQVCETVMSRMRDYSWGGASILWHNDTFWNTPNIGQIYWQIKRADDKWIPARELVEKVWGRYSQTGLLPKKLPTPGPVVDE